MRIATAMVFILSWTVTLALGLPILPGLWQLAGMVAIATAVVVVVAIFLEWGIAPSPS
jgi:hypothetical protein